MSRLQLEGIFVPHITPFRREGTIDSQALCQCVRFWVDAGLSGLMTCGSNGEAPYLSREERKQIIKIVIDEVDGKIPVIAGTGSMSTRETIQFTNDAKDLGVDAAVIVTPFYFKLSNRELYEHYSAVIQAVDLPVVLYSVPKFTGFHLEPSVVAWLCSEYDAIVGVKDSSGNLGNITEIIRLVGDNISVLAGTTDVVLPTLLLGGCGAVIAVANVVPQLCSAFYKLVKQGDYEKASELQGHLSYYNEVLVKEHNQLAAIKEALTLQGIPAGYPRRPTLPLEKDAKKKIEILVRTKFSY